MKRTNQTKETENEPMSHVDTRKSCISAKLADLQGFKKDLGKDLNHEHNSLKGRSNYVSNITCTIRFTCVFQPLFVPFFSGVSDLVCVHGGRLPPDLFMISNRDTNQL